MTATLRRIRAILAMGVSWGVVWSAVGTLPRWVFGINADVPFPLVFGVLGFIAGGIFATLLTLANRRRTFDQLSLPRFAAWGAVGGVLLSGVFARIASLGWADVIVVAPVLTGACAVCAAGSLALARRATRRELPDPHADRGHAVLIDRHYEKLK